MRSFLRPAAVCLACTLVTMVGVRVGTADEGPLTLERFRQELGEARGSEALAKWRQARTLPAGRAWSDPAARARGAAVVWPRLETPSQQAMLLRTIVWDDLAEAWPTVRKGLAVENEAVIAQALATTLALAPDDAVPAVEPLLGHASGAVRTRAVRALASLGSLAQMLPLLADADAGVRAAVASAMGRLGSAVHVPALAARLADEAAAVRAAAALALGRLGATDQAAAIAHLLAGSEPVERWQAAWALGELRAGEHAPALVKLLTDEDPWPRGFAIWALGRLGEDPRAQAFATAIAPRLDDENGWVRVYAVQALGNLEARSHAQAIAAHLDDLANVSLLRYDDPERVAFKPANVAQEAHAVLQAWGHDFTADAARIADQLGAEDIGRVTDAIEALTMMAAREHLPRIVALAGHDNWGVRRDVIWSIAVFGAGEHAALLARHLDDPSPTVRAQAAWGLGILRSKAHRKALAAKVGDKTLCACVNGSASPLPTECIGRQSLLTDFAEEALARIDGER